MSAPRTVQVVDPVDGSRFAIQGSPDGQPARELHASARQIVNRAFCQPLQKAFADFEKHGHSGRVSSDPQEVIRAAYEGRVADLFLSSGAEVIGCWDDAARGLASNRPADGGEDLLNAAALQTVLHGGNPFALSETEMPGGAEVAAVLRF